MNPGEFKIRTKKLALKVIRIVGSLPKSEEARIIGRQLLRCGTSVGANYRSACLARSNADFIAKMGIVQEEADEAMYWMELLQEANIFNGKSLNEAYDECHQILSMVIASIKTARSRKLT